MNNINLSPDKMEMLLSLASQKLGKDPQQLKSQLENGELNQVIGGLDPKIQSQISALANNPKALEAILKGGNIGNLISGLAGGRK